MLAYIVLLGLLSGGEDWPDAYRYTPMRPEESKACVVVWWHPEKSAPVFQIYHGLLFGLPNAVTSFNRWSKFAQALVRRLLMMLFSMYFDDATMQDWESEAFHSQACVADLEREPGLRTYVAQLELLAGLSRRWPGWFVERTQSGSSMMSQPSWRW